MAPHPLVRRTCEPRPLVQAGQIRPAPLAGAINLGPGRQIVSQDSPDGVSRIGGQAGTQAPDATPLFSQDQGSRAGSTIHSLPAEYLRLTLGLQNVVPAYRSSGSVSPTAPAVPRAKPDRRRQHTNGRLMKDPGHPSAGRLPGPAVLVLPGPGNSQVAPAPEVRRNAG
jgi:hypothetical protein